MSFFLVFSDSHRDLQNMKRILDKTGSWDGVIFLGDCYDDGEIIKREYHLDPFYSVAGNCDFGRGSAEECIFVEGCKIWICHGHGFGVKSNYGRISAAALQREADCCLFGHTHAAEIFEDKGILFMNPGSVSFSRSSDGESYGVLKIEKDRIEAAVVEIKPSGFRPVKELSLQIQ